ncbi:MAG: hypothetical protein ACRDHN_00340 [Thermomicrobiales bacterium]
MDRFGSIRSGLRPLNLIIIQQGLWPLLVLMGEGPRITEPEGLPWDWWAIRVIAPAIAALLAFMYVHRDPRGSGTESPDYGRIIPSALNTRSLRLQVTFALIGLPLMVAAVRLIDGPIGYATKIAAFGAVDALAFQIISFGVAYRLFPDERRGTLAAVGFFALSWGIRDLILAGVGDSGGSMFFTLIGGLLAGLLIALCSLAIRRWPGGFWPAWGAQWLVITLIIGFT